MKMKIEFFPINNYASMRTTIWEMTHLYVRNHVIWKLDQREELWTVVSAAISDQIKETLRS